jgi:hypothetical protein
MCTAREGARTRARAGVGVRASVSASACLPLRKISYLFVPYIEGICFINDAP